MPLTDLDLVKARLYGNEPSKGDPFDTLLTTLIAEATSRIESKLGYAVEDATYTDYVDGQETVVLYLPRGPLISVTSVEEIKYQDGGAGVRDEVETLLAAYQYVPRGLVADGHKGIGYVERVDGGVFTSGLRNWKVVHVSGWTTVPKDIQALATWMIVAEFQSRDAAGLLAQTVGDSAKQFFSPERYDEQIERCLGPYLGVGVL